MHEDDRLELDLEHGHIVLRPQTVRASLAELIAGITPKNLHTAAFDNLVGAEAW
jgi:antitoxin component of MazEF toxin-antitoxin module